MPIKFTINRIRERERGKVAIGEITWKEKGLTTVALSGPYGRGLLPAGLYHAYRNDLLDKKPSSGFCDSLNQCWFQFLRPQFSTSRNELGIHPDGGKLEGTKGCIGLPDANTINWFKAFKSVPRSEYTIVEVIIKV